MVTTVALVLCAGIGLGHSGFSFSRVIFFTIGGCLIPLLLRPPSSSRSRAALVRLLPLVLVGGFLLGAGARPVAGPATPRTPTAESEAGAAARVRGSLEDRILRRFPSQGSMVAALLLAERDGVDRELRDAFRRTGTSHLLAISGFHVGVIAGWIVLVLRLLRFSRHQAIVGAAMITWLYAALLGFPGSAVRAATIFALLAAGRVFDRPVRGLGAWGAALLLIAVVRPAEILRVGTQLSFLGSLGLILWAVAWGDGLGAFVARVMERCGATRTPALIRPLSQAIAASAAAQCATLPLAAWSFQQVALVGLPATLLATPLVSLALPGALVTLLADAVHLPGTVLLAAGVEAALSTLELLIAGAGQHGPVVHITPVTVGFAVLVGVAARWVGRGRPGLRAAGLVPIAVACAALLASPIASAGRRASTEIHFLDVGQGDAIALRTREGRWVVIDTGPPPGGRLVQSLLRLGVARIDLLVLSHPDLDHIGGAMDLLDAIPVAEILDPMSVKGGQWRALVDRAIDHGVNWRRGTANDRFAIDEVQFSVLSPRTEMASMSVNDRSIVLFVEIGGFDALFTGDISVEVESALAPLLTDVDLLKVAHHGSRTSTGADFLSRIQPETSVVQVGRWNRFGHPAEGVIRRLRDSGSRILRTDRDGQVSLYVANGALLRVETQVGWN